MVHHLIQNTGTNPTVFARLTRAWRHGGPMGITVAEQPYTPDPTVMKAARTALGTALSEMTDSPTHLRSWRNRLTLTHHGIQLRLGPDARWYPYLQDDDGEWWPAAPADSDPVTALTAGLVAERGVRRRVPAAQEPRPEAGHTHAAPLP